MSKTATGQQERILNLTNYHNPLAMSSGQVQDYIDLLIKKHDVLGDHYVARQLAWAVVELERVQ